MNNQTTINVQELFEQIQRLPPSNLPEIAEFVDFLRFKTQKKPTTSLRVVKLGGLLKGYDFPPELLVEARAELWRKFHSDQT